jgi:hypothetical protein
VFCAHPPLRCTTRRRFNKLHAYGAEAERVDSLMMGPGHMSERGEKLSTAARF